MPIDDKNIGRYTRPWVDKPSEPRPLVFKINNNTRYGSSDLFNNYFIELTKTKDSSGYSNYPRGIPNVTRVTLPSGISLRVIGRSRIDGNWIFYMIRDENFLKLKDSIHSLVQEANFPGLTNFSIQLISTIEDHMPKFDMETFLNVYEDEDEDSNYEEWTEE